jgi:RNA recognition motif-containing protein
VVKNKANNESLTYGFVMYANLDDATNAMRSLNGYSVLGKQIKVSLATRKQSHEKNCKLYVTRIPFECPEMVLYQLFSEVDQLAITHSLISFLVWKYHRVTSSKRRRRQESSSGVH